MPTSPAASMSALARAKALAQGQTTPSLSGGFYPLPNPQMTHPENTTVFVGGLPGSVGREELESVFRPFGEVTYVNVPPGKACGFISFDNRSSAEWAIEQLQGFWLHGAQLRLSWGRAQGEKARQQQSHHIVPGELAAAIQQDVPFLTQMLDLTADQRVKLGLYLEFAGSGNLARLKDIMSATNPSLYQTPSAPSSSSVQRRPESPCTCAPLPASKHDPYQVHGDLCRHYDRLVSDPIDYTSPHSDVSPASAVPSTPPLSYTTDTSPTYPTSPRLSTAASDTKVQVHRASSSVSSEAVFVPFQPWKTSGKTEHQHSHSHTENCVTPMSLQQLDRLNGRGQDVTKRDKGNAVERPGWGMGAMGLNAGAGEWVPPVQRAGSGGYSAAAGVRGRW